VRYGGAYGAKGVCAGGACAGGAGAGWSRARKRESAELMKTVKKASELKVNIYPKHRQPRAIVGRMGKPMSSTRSARQSRLRLPQ
jgi:hypothetical protein